MLRPGLWGARRGAAERVERVRAESTRFVHAPGHVDPVYERVVARRSRYAVVEKFGRGLATIVRRLDPRRSRSGNVAEERAT
jgi:hypothetical protein